MQNYASLQETHDQDEQGILVHVAEPTRSKWNHIEDLDSFFTRMYKYHQKHGFLCMLLNEIFELNQYIFVVFLTTYLIFGIDYDKLFSQNDHKLTFSEILLPLGQVYDNLTTLACFLLILAVIFCGFKFLTKSYQVILSWDIKQFYNTALAIADNDLDNITWSDIQTKIKQVQLEQQMCIHKREITELDIYHRILRQENYFVAMVNKKLLPPRMNIPFIGEVVYWTKGLRINMQGLLFWSPWSPFENPWHLREEYKRPNLRHELAHRLGRQILWCAFVNLMLLPVILVWQLLYSFFSYGELLRREPGRLGLRNWSLYAKLYLRHFNELDHELHARLTRAYRPATKYLAAFSSPTVTIIAQHIAFICGSLFAVIIIYTLIDDNILSIEHLLPVMTFLGIAIPVCRGFIPDESLVWCPESLLQGVVMHTHYLPSDWKGQAHTSKIKEEFQQLFQYRVVALLEDILSPILTPYLMWRWMYPRSLDIVDFFRNFTVSVVGVGDVCSFAQMDIKKHGNPEWQTASESHPPEGAPDQYRQAEEGKVELSLMHFTTTNPCWVPPKEAQDFIDIVQHEALPYSYNDDVRIVGSLEHLLESSSLADFDMRSVLELRKSARLDSVLDPNFNSGRETLWQTDPYSSLPRMSLRLVEGPDLLGPINMRNSAMAIHDIHYRHTDRQARSVEETTPLLSSRP